MFQARLLIKGDTRFYFEQDYNVDHIDDVLNLMQADIPAGMMRDSLVTDIEFSVHRESEPIPHIYGDGDPDAD